MKKLLPILALLALMLVPWTSRAQSVTIGTGTSTQNSAPVANYYNYSLAEMIFTAEEIAAGSPTVNTIVSVGFECTASVNKEYGITIYMKNVDADAFTAASDYVALTAEDVVYTGTLTPTSGWTTIDLDAPFTYDNTQNLLIAVNKTSGGYSGSTAIWKYTSTSSTYRMLWKQNDGSAYDPTASPSLDPNYNRPNVQLTFGTPSACSKPTNIQVSDITSDGATISWSPNSDEAQWQITIDNQVVGLAQDAPTYTLTGLEPNTAYTVGVAAVCSADDITAAATATFRTGFAGQYVTLADSTATNQYIPIYGNYVDEAQHNQIVYPASMMQELLGNDLTGFVFYMGTVAASSWNTTVTVSLGTSTGETLSALSDAIVNQVWQGTVSGMDELWTITFDEPYRYTGGNLLVDITTTEGTYKMTNYLGISAANGSSVCTYSANVRTQAFLPKVTMFYEENDSPVCLTPTNVLATGTSSSVILEWTAGGEETLWEVLLNGEPIGQATNTNFTITGLDPMTQYQVSVSSVCGNDHSTAISTTVNTLCDGDSCTFTAELSGTLYTSSYSNGAIDLYQNGVLAGSLTTATTNGVEVCSSTPVELRHHTSSSYSSGTAIVYNGGGEVVFSSSSVSGSTGTVLATIEVPCPSCFVPANIELSNINEQGFTLSWTPGAGETAWQITVTAPDGGTQTFYSQTTSYTVSQLADNTEYTVELRADCGNDGLSGAATLTVKTPVAGFEPATVPYNCGFDPNDVQYWEFVNGDTNIWVVNNENLYVTKSTSETLENSYDNSKTSVSYAFRQMEIEETAVYYFQFDYTGQGESNYDYMRAWVAPASAELTADKLPNGSSSSFSSYTTTTPTGWYDLGGKMNQQSDWTHVGASAELTAGSYKLVFMWCNDGNGGDNPPAAVDNISINQVNEILISARSADETMGSVEGFGLYTYGDEVTLTAIPATDNYYFTHWSTGETTPTINVTANLAAQTTEYIAYFEANVATINGYAHNQLGGTVEGSGEYANGDTATLTATPAEGWHFSRWSDGNTDNPRLIEATVNMNLEAFFVHPYDMANGEMYLDFEQMGAEYVDMSNGGLANQWAIGQTDEATHMNQAIFISNDGGQTNAYTIGQEASVFAWVNLTLEPGLYDFSYDWKYRGSGSNYMRVALVPESTPTTASSSTASGWTSYNLPSGAIALDSSSALYNHTTWSSKSKSFELTEGGNYKLVFYWRNITSTYSDNNPPAAVDNIRLYHNNEPIGLIAYGDRQHGWVETDQGEYYYGDTATLVAMANEGYIFNHWSTGETTDTIRVPVNLAATETEYIAYFLPNNPTLYVSYSPNMGTVNGINAESNSISVANGDSITIEAVANEGYYFGQWSDGNIDNPRTIVLTDDLYLSCDFLQPLEELNVDFENGDGGIVLANGTCTNKWVVGTSADGGNTSLFISNNGVDNTYTNTSSSNVFAYYPMYLKPGVYNYNFDWLCNGESTYDYLRVAIVPANVPLEASTGNYIWNHNNLPAGVTALDGGSKLNLQESWQSFAGSVEVPEGGLYKFVFYWRNDHNGGSQPPAAVDNISLVNTHARYMVNTYPQDGDYGYVDGGGQYDYGEQVTLIAHPYVGYMVAFWTHNNDTLYGESITVKVTSDETPYVAWLTPPSVTIHTDYIHDLISVYDQDNNFIESYSEYTYEGGRNLTFTAVIAEGYQVDILLNGIHGNYLRESGYNTTSTLNLFAGDNYNLEFYWRGIPVQVTVNATNGTDNTFGTIATYYGNDISIVAAPAPGYQFLGWEDDPSASSIRSFTVDFTHDTTFTAIIEPIVCLPDTEYVHDTTVVTDTAYVEVEIHDTTYVDVHDTTYVDVHDTTYVEVPVHDTTYVDVHDTTYVDVHDTTYVDVHDTTYVEVPIHDTTFVDVHDTTYVEVPVHDTTFVDVHDTTYVDVHDTTYVEVPIHDTTIVTEVDTLTLVQFDTVYLQVAVHDTTTMLVHDTMYVNRYIYDSLYFYDTTYVHDTTYITNWKHDTTYVTVNDSIIQTLVDTMYIYVNDTTQIYNIVHDTTYINIHDTTVIINYDTLTVTNTVYSIDTVILNNYIHDTTVVDHFVHDTTYIPVHDTMYVYRYTHDSLYFYDTTYVHDTSYVYQWRYDTTYVTVNDSIIQTLVDTMYIYVNDTTQIYNFVHDTTLVFIHDTTIVTLYDTLTVTNTIVDSVILNNYIHDTAIVTLYDTITLTQTDTVTNTEYVFDTVTNTVYDTVTNTVYDTVTNTEYVFDTVTNTVYDTVTNTEYVFDTTLVTDTLWLTDTVYITLTDTVYIHDTVYVGIDDDATMANVKLYQRDGQIIVEGAEGARVMLFDAVGRQLATKTDEYDVLRFDVPSTGAYLIKVGNAPARRIVVVR